MRIIAKYTGAHGKVIAIVSAGGIRGRRDGDALVGWGRTGELADEPAVGDMVVEHDRVAAATGADAAEAGPDRVDGNWPKDRCTGCLVKDLIAFVHNLNVLSESHGAVGIGRRAAADDTWKRDTVKVQNSGRHNVGNQDPQIVAVVNDRIRSVHMQGEGQLGIQIRFAHFPFVSLFPFLRGPEHRKIAQRR